MALFTHLKIILLQFFQFSVISDIQTDHQYTFGQELFSYVWCFAFSFLFFLIFFIYTCFSFQETNYTVHALFTNGSCTIYTLFTRPTTTLFKKKIKNGFHGTIHTFKNYFATIFSVFSKISYIQMDTQSSQKKKKNLRLASLEKNW